MVLYYLDTSALVKRYKRERGSEVVAELIGNRRLEDSFVTSALTRIEVTSTAARILRTGLMDTRSYEDYLRNFARDAREFLVLYPITENTVSLATRMSARYALRSLDAIHLGTAVITISSTRVAAPAVIVSADGRLCSAAATEGYPVLDPMSDRAMQQLRQVRSSG